MGALVLAATQPRAAIAADKLLGATVSYRDHPNGDKRCANCVHFVPSKKPQVRRCQIVAGTVSSQGYCIVWAPRNTTDGC